MIIVANRIRVHPDYADSFEATFGERAGLVDQMDGFIRFQILKPVRDGDPYVVQTFWESRAAFEQWTQSEAFRQQHGQRRRLPPQALLGQPQIEVHEIIENTANL